VTDGVNRFKLPDNIVANAKREEVNAALAAAHLQPDIFVTPYNPIVVNTGQKLVVVDTGLGEAGFNATKGANGQFLTNLAAAGIDAKAIDTVIISHYHGDHVNGLLKADNSLAFPNAEILVPAAEHTFWMDDGEMSRAPKGRMEDLFKNNRRVFAGEVMKRLRTYDEGKEVVSGVTAVGTHGHSAGHNSHVVSSGSSTVYVQADVTHVPFLFARNPGWHAFYDQDPVWRRQPAARSTTCWWRKRCCFRASTIRSPRSPMSRRMDPAIARFRCPGIRRSERLDRLAAHPAAAGIRWHSWLQRADVRVRA
jgi:glyoxylase-like metal-dependent hydrolase (beta-lactamase superfamily II)